jgi:hypothetical protein
MLACLSQRGNKTRSKIKSRMSNKILRLWLHPAAFCGAVSLLTMMGTWHARAEEPELAPSQGSKSSTRDAGGTSVPALLHPALADWPCRQVYVPEISLPAVWSGPSIKGIDWRHDPAIASLVARLAARKTPLEEAERAIDELAAGGGSNKNTKLTQLFAGLFETLNAERNEVQDGLIRYGRKLKDLARKIRAEQASQNTGENTSAGTATATGRATAPEGSSSRQAWDLRVFEERRQAMTYVCETPALIERRLFALARMIEQQFD